ncbi:MAG: HU family DNA-binding protein [Desulfobulbus sp.]
MQKQHQNKTVKRTMNKGELIERVADECGLTRYAAGLVIKSVFKAISEALAANDKVKLVGFGTFSVAQRSPRNVRLPRTGEVMRIPTRKAIRFKAGAAFMETIRSPH